MPTLSGPRDTFWKEYTHEFKQLAVERSLRAEALGVSSGLFFHPPIIRVQGSAILMDFVEGLVPIHYPRRSAAYLADPAAFLCAGKALAGVHESLPVPHGGENLRLGWPASPVDVVHLHGDFKPDNVLRSACGRICLLDWDVLSYFGTPFVVGSRYFDLAFFIHAVVLRSCGFLRHGVRYPPITDWLQKFVTGYESELGRPLDMVELRRGLNRCHARMRRGRCSRPPRTARHVAEMMAMPFVELWVRRFPIGRG